MTSHFGNRTRFVGVTLPPFQTLIDAHGGEILGFLVAQVGASDADDCFQETFLAALRAYPRLEHATNLRAWLFTIASRKAIDHHRANGRRPLPLERLPEASAAPVERDDLGVWAAVRRLPPKQRTALTLRFVGDLAYREIAATMACSEEAARRSVHEGLKRLEGVLR